MCLEPLAGERQNNETDKAIQACNDYLRMGSGRSLSKLQAYYGETYQNQAPTKSLATLMEWSTRWGWQARCSLYDADWDARKTAERETALSYGLALDYERVEKLKRLAGLLEAQLYETNDATGVYHNIWLPDVKQIGSGDDVERVDIERFNAPLISEYRAVLDDLAKEVGGRIRKQEVSGKDGGAIPIAVVPVDYRQAIDSLKPDDSDEDIDGG